MTRGDGTRFEFVRFPASTVNTTIGEFTNSTMINERVISRMDYQRIIAAAWSMILTGEFIKYRNLA